MHSAGLELTKLTYTGLEDNMIRHRGDRPLYYARYACISSAVFRGLYAKLRILEYD